MDNKKDLYVDNCLIGCHCGDSLFDDVYIEHNSLPEIRMEDISTRVSFMGEEFSFPLIISSMTGGTEMGLELNEILIKLAKEFNLPIELGSQDDYLGDEVQANLFVSSIEENKEDDIFIISNLSAKSTLEEIKKANKLIDARGISLYLNPAQEGVAYDGDTDFTGVLANLEEISKTYSDNLLVKEKAMGMSKATVEKLVKAGVKYVDLSGYGGSNFMEMENLRNYKSDFSDLYCWGIPTAKSIINARSASDTVKIIASGGIRTGLDIVKALILGADYVAIAGELLKYILHGGYEQGRAYLEDLIYKTRLVMFLLGAKNLADLRNVPYKITGKLKEIL